MNRKYKAAIFILLILGEIILNKYARPFKLNLDLLYLILVYISIKSGFVKCMLAAAVIGLITDYFSMNVIGVFGFSRTLAAFLLNEVSQRIDLKNNLFVFLMIFISLALSNIIANTFFSIILHIGFNWQLILIQPMLTSLVGISIAFTEKAKGYLDVY